MPKPWHRDPIRAAYDLWVDQGWAVTADGMTAVTSLLRVHQLLTQRADRILAPVGLTFARYEVLVVLYFNEDAVSLSYLARALQLRQASVTGLVDKLERQGLLTREAHRGDRRVTLARITDAGRERIRDAIERLSGGLYARLGLGPEQTRQLVGLLATIRDAWGDLPADVEDDGIDAGADAAGRDDQASRDDQAGSHDQAGRDDQAAADAGASGNGESDAARALLYVAQPSA
ncbi:MarR family transcriptional regulator, organic hydroperoxide resistance regulator [Frankia sp. AiPs1]|uniref:MarR family winged helix-turn-helix transcriptional regulator n=1 Tax=Frankia sp. AiPa1 TaxID=573492 RepID=UPI00202B2477|nr:MarR family transcriptional regulator [Frankia sp. AiPa1]MCL9760050.1 MarR family transcriptional regulator [Frankia sp. AiPa1]